MTISIFFNFPLRCVSQGTSYIIELKQKLAIVTCHRPYFFIFEQWSVSVFVFFCVFLAFFFASTHQIFVHIESLLPPLCIARNFSYYYFETKFCKSDMLQVIFLLLSSAVFLTIRIIDFFLFFAFYFISTDQIYVHIQSHLCHLLTNLPVSSCAQLSLPRVFGGDLLYAIINFIKCKFCYYFYVLCDYALYCK